MKILVFKDIKNKRWTLWNLSKTKHLGYRSFLVLENCKLIVDESKRKKVIKTKKRFPHAFIIGTISNAQIMGKKEITYNPFRDKSFKKGARQIKTSKLVVFTETGKCFSL